MRRFAAYGECLESTFDLGAFLPPSRDAEPSLSLRQGRVQVPGASLEEVLTLDVHGRRVRGLRDTAMENFSASQRWIVEVGETGHFSWRDGQPDLTVDVLPGVSKERMVFWFLHIVLPFYLSRNRPLLFLHAGAVALRDCAIALAAPSGTGKSSLVSACLARDLKLVTDDKLAIRLSGETALALPSHPHCRDYRALEDLGRRTRSFAGEALPLAALFMVARDSTLREPLLESVTGGDRFRAALPALLYHFSADAVTPARQLARLVDQVPVYSLTVPDDARQIDAVVDRLVAESASLAG